MGATPELAKSLTAAAAKGYDKEKMSEEEMNRRGQFMDIDNNALGVTMPTLRIDG